jgi:hypothetical protein
MRVRFSIVLVICFMLTLGTFAGSEELSDSLASPKPDFDEVFADALRCIKMTPEDLVFRDDYVDMDSFRLTLIDRLMRKPMETAAFNSRVLEEWNAAQPEERRFSLISKLSGYLSARGKPVASVEGREAVQRLNLEDNQFIREYKKKLKKLPPPLRNSLAYLFVGMLVADSKTEEAFARLSNEERGFIKGNLPMILEEDVDDEFKTPEQLDEEGDIEEQRAKDMLPHLAKVDLEKIIQAGEELAFATKACIPLLRDYLESSPQLKPLVKDKEDKKNDLIFRLQTTSGEIIIGGFNSSKYSGSPAVVIDLGGDDEYNISYNPEKEGGSSVIIDMGGNDVYRTSDYFTYGSGFWGTGILVDLSGDDAYLASDFSLGSGLLGVGLLVDEEGDDKYFGDTFTMGAGSFGMGLLVDMEGSDQYSGALFAQGFGFVSGLGALIDSCGNDNYFAGGRYKDILRYKDHYISLSQGFAYGLRPMMSGGIGILFDLSGNDTYNSDIFGQGSSYWFSLGTLLDREGNDKYVSFQYAQGAGTHLCLGILEDEKGDDVYISHGVSQGCGHDLALGILRDKDGNDNYIAESLSQGAGSANGFGIMIDEGGDDGYYVSIKANTQGYGNPRRDYGSVGMLLDFSGKDLYRGNGTDSTWWTTPSKWGIGVDR